MTEPPEKSAKERSRQQFGAHAEAYATSPVHARGASLDRMVELVAPQPHEEALDIATAAGHTAFAFAPLVDSVLATDLTPEMVALARRRATELGYDNVRSRIADAENLPFDDASFDIASCRIAPHHFPNPARFVAEVARVLRPGGRFALVDNVADDDPDVARWCDDWERRRDPSHVRCLALAEWLALVEGFGLDPVHVETADKRMDLDSWAERMGVEPDETARLRADLEGATPAVRAFLRPRPRDDGLDFYLTEGLIVARRSG